MDSVMHSNKTYLLDDLEEETKEYINDLKAGTNNILVAVRSRPLTSKEASISRYETVRILNKKVVVLLDPAFEFNEDDVLKRNREKQYAFDFAFDCNTNQEDIYEKTTKFLIDGILSGYNATVFCYGATGAGKTYTMIGNPETPGIMFLTLDEMFTKIEQVSNSENKDFAVKASYLEIYNENIRDLLSVEDENLDLREDPVRGVCVSGITEILSTSTSEVRKILRIGNKNRTIEPTGANEVSSRSHAVLQVLVEHKDRSGEKDIKVGKLSLIDLAGSERASATNNRGIRLVEGANINRSLLALGNCINALSEANEKGIKSNVHIPYRDSKLTRLLKDSLGGNCRTVMIANISPAVNQFEDTHNTLKYANRAKNIKTTTVRNVLNVTNHVQKYQDIINTLKAENEKLKALWAQQQRGGPVNQPAIVSPQNSQANRDKLQIEIQEHFQGELELKKQLLEMEEMMENLGFSLYRSLHEKNKTGVDDIKSSLKTYSNKIQDLNNRYDQLCNKRSSLSDKIQDEFLKNLFRKLSLEIENIEFQRKEKRVDAQIKQKEMEIDLLQQQINLRDELISDNKTVLTNNKVNLNSTYTILKTVDQIHEETKKLSLPSIDQIKRTLASPSPKFDPRPMEAKLSLPSIRRPPALNNIDEGPAYSHHNNSMINMSQEDIGEEHEAARQRGRKRLERLNNKYSSMEMGYVLSPTVAVGVRHSSNIRKQPESTTRNSGGPGVQKESKISLGDKIKKYRTPSMTDTSYVGSAKNPTNKTKQERKESLFVPNKKKKKHGIESLTKIVSGVADAESGFVRNFIQQPQTMKNSKSSSYIVKTQKGNQFNFSKQA